MEQWNNVELTSLRKKSYTLNHEYDLANKCIVANNNSEAPATTNNNANGDETSSNANQNNILKPGSNIKPKVTSEDVESLVRRLYGITINEIKELISYDDRNYLIQPDWNIKNPIITTQWPHGYILKILNALDSKKPNFVDAQNELMLYLAKEGIICPRPIENVNGKYFSVENINGADHVVRLLEFVPGQMFHEVEKSNYLLYKSGEFIAKVDRTLKNFQHEVYDTHKTLWMLESVPRLREFLYVLQDISRKAIVEEIIDAFEKNVLTQLDKLEKQIIHGDYNEQNIIVEQSKKSADGEYKVKGIIDFGDTNKSPIIFEIGIALTYMILQAKSLESGGYFIAGYTDIRPISTEERSLLKYCVAARLAQSLVMGAYTHSLDQSNEYVLVTQEEGWKMIVDLWRNKFNEVEEMWQTTADKYLTQSVK
ncbi:PREDICTED: hydroxylysine kinase [Rhagoletis zephyria]|uniref:hydroxylysine kinase n=1 Tax=Rhagoletis zephyria TaxID=28612 RepID=UPI0008119C1B|nr:PREDICTED: hydroxylysine kinase [Rhagoletis zephyria]XP_017475432.1 PREDICTED: hydroxylysine kinase [Rhagoletis zephyria]XP_017475433.1 PREDICTED: hydroxylysine kinase [Rhagoletis zephyria]XP_017475434.1 PREDICTED: hydroxylysine kinase [Rhagoletis zephyria]